MLQYKEYYMPQSKEELFRFIENIDRSYHIISGGTDLFAKEKSALKGVELAIDISNIDAFSTVTVEQDRITFGANTKIQQFLQIPELMENVPMLRHAACYFADQQIREIATVGGNLANSSPSGDMIPPLLALDASVHTVMKKEGVLQEKEIPTAEFIQGVGKNMLAQGEIISAVSCPILKGWGCAFKKVGLRRSLCISTVNSAFLVKTDPAGRRFEDVRIAFGGIAPVPQRLKKIEDALRGSLISKDIIQKMIEYIPSDVVKSRSRKEYRNTVVKNFVLAGLYESLAELGVVPE